VFQVFQIIREAQTISRGNRFQPARNGIRIHILGDIRGMDDLCQPQQTYIFRRMDSNEHRPS
jgi:hypothetical protein